MTKQQRITLMADWWPRACAAQGWDADDRDKRLEVLGAAVKRPLASASELNTREDIDAVKAHLQALCDNMKAAQEANDPAIGRARRLRAFIRENLLPCLAIYLGEHTRPRVSPSAPSPAESYLLEILTSLSRWHRTDRPTVPISLEDLDAAALNRVIMTLSARIQAKRAAAGDTVHDMKIKARVPCNCKQCTQRAVTVARADRPARQQAYAEGPF